ncbi:hypothetical protein SPLC1_S412050 [Arthrospira platensis C1]|nr:hypothetical protein SPLC1_S412050 [Arthrospira platensis C1]
MILIGLAISFSSCPTTWNDIRRHCLAHLRTPRSAVKRLSPQSTESDICDRNLVRGNLRNRFSATVSPTNQRLG